MMYPEDREKVYSTYNKWSGDKFRGTLHLDYRIINRFRKIVWLDTYLYADFDSNGEPESHKPDLHRYY